ncbi:MAG: DNA polymerase III subunit delta [Acidobacteriota bacterium]
MTTDQLRDQLRRREIAPVYVLFGPEINLRDLAAKTISDFSFSPGDMRDFNESEFSLAIEGNLQRAFAAANQLPMMSARRVIRLTDVRVSASGHRDTVREDDEPILLEYLKDPSSSSVIIFVADDLNGVRKMGKLLRSHAAAVEFKPLDDGEVEQWVLAAFKKAGAQIDGQAMRRFVALVGNDSARIVNEAEKLATAALPDKVVTMDLIDALVPNSRELSNFDLTDNLIGKDKGRSMSILRKILDDGAEPVMLLGLISYNFRRLLSAKDMMSRGVDRGEISKIMNLRFRDQEDFLATARRAETFALQTAIRRLADTDLAIKTSVGGSGPVGARLQIEMLVAELAML